MALLCILQNDDAQTLGIQGETGWGCWNRVGHLSICQSLSGSHTGVLRAESGQDTEDDTNDSPYIYILQNRTKEGVALAGAVRNTPLSLAAAVRPPRGNRASSAGKKTYGQFRTVDLRVRAGPLRATIVLYGSPQPVSGLSTASKCKGKAHGTYALYGGCRGLARCESRVGNRQ